MPWVYLLIASALEIVWATGMKYSAGFSHGLPTVITLTAAYASFHFLSLAVKSLPIGSAYAIWTGIGAVGTVILGMILFNESRDLPRLASITLILLGVVGLRVFTK